MFIAQVSLRRAIAEYMAHFHEERNHQGLGNRLIQQKTGECCERCGHSSSDPARRNAQLSPPCCCLKDFVPFSGHYGDSPCSAA